MAMNAMMIATILILSIPSLQRFMTKRKSKNTYTFIIFWGTFLDY